MQEKRTSSGISLRGRSVPAYIAIEGPIGVGKTTLARRIADTFQHDLLLEEAELNPFLERFYQNRQQTALATQLFFLFQFGPMPECHLLAMRPVWTTLELR